MLTRWILENFKPFRDRIDIPLAGVTVFAGLNSSGKSSILQSVLTITQTLRHQSQDRPLVLNGSLIQLGTFDQVHNDRTSDDFLRIGFEMRLESDREGITIRSLATFTEAEERNLSSEGARSPTRMGLRDTSFVLSKQAEDSTFTARRLSAAEEVTAQAAFPGKLSAEYPGSRTIAEATLITNSHIHDSVSVRPPFFWPLSHFLPGAELHSINDLSAAAGSWVMIKVQLHSFGVTNFFGQFIRYLGPLRADPAAAQGYAPSDEPDDVGSRGEYAAARYETSQHTQIQFIDPFDDQQKTDTLAVAIDRWARYLGVAHHVATLDTKVGVAWMIQSGDGTADRPLAAVGVGVSQVLPVLVGGLLAPKGSTFIMEQPELHLHARAQARLGDFFYAMSRLGKQCLLETHSDTLIRQLRYRMVREGQPARDAIAIYFIEQDQTGTSRIQPIEISPSGNILNWPDGFCDEAFLQEDRIVEASLKARAGVQP